MTVTTLRTARQAFFAEQNIPEGTYEEAWARLDFFGLPFYIPNNETRARSLRVHDLHHILTGYATDFPGEAEISAWELATGCRDHYVAWVLNTVAVVMGMFVVPGRVIAAWRRGCRSRNLYHLEDGEFDRVLEAGVGATRREMRL